METESYANAKLKGLPRSVRDTIWRMRNPEEDGEKKYTYVEILAWLLSEHGVESSLAAMTPYLAWEKFNRDMEAGFAAAEAAKMEYLDKHPEATPEKLQEVGQYCFTARSMAGDNLDGFVKLGLLWEKKQARLFDEKKYADAAAKAAQADAAKEVLTQKITTEEQNRRIREILK